MGEQQLDLFGDLPGEVEKLSPNDSLWPARLEAMADYIRSEVELAVSDRDMARRIACRVTARLTMEYGGTHWYVPKPDVLRRLLRDLEIWSEFDGSVDGLRGVNALARKYNLSAVWVWAVIRAQRRLYIKRVHGDLFEGLDDALPALPQI